MAWFGRRRTSRQGPEPDPDPVPVDDEAQEAAREELLAALSRATGLVASDGMADPWTDGSPGPGLGAEVYLASTAFAVDGWEEVRGTWQLSALAGLVRNVAHHQIPLGARLQGGTARRSCCSALCCCTRTSWDRSWLEGWAGRTC